MVFADLAVTDSVQEGLNEFFAWLPELVAALVILIVGYFVAKIVAAVVGRLLGRAGLDRSLHGGAGGNYVRKVTDSPSGLIATIVFWVVFLGALSLAVTTLGIEALTDFVASVYAYLPNVFAALAIFLIAGAIAAGAATFARRFLGDTPVGRVVSAAAPILVMTIATFMILDQLMIAEDIVVITYAGIIGAVALGTALAFGLGGREVAGRMLEGAYQTAQENKDEWKRDLDQGVSRARDEAEDVREQHSGDGRATPVHGGPQAR